MLLSKKILLSILVLGMLIPGMLVLTVPAAAAYASGPAATATISSDAVTTARTISPLNLRPQPNTTRAPIAVIPRGTTIDVLGRNEAARWLSVVYRGQQGWVSAYYVVLASGQPLDLPVVGAQPSAQPSAPLPQEPAPSDPYAVHLSNVGPQLDAIYQRGQQLGNNPHVFTKVGDCEMEFKWFLQDFDAGVYDLGSYQYLQGVLTQYAGSFAYKGQVANAGMSSSAIFQDYWSDPTICYPGETPLACEYRIRKPSVALLMLRTIDRDAVANGQFYAEVTRATWDSIERGIIPVLQTIPYWGPTNPDTMAINDVIRRVATENNVPLWDYWATSEQLPNHGVTSDYHIDRPADGSGVTFFTADRMQIAANRRNLEALEVLHAVLTEVQN